MNERNIRFTLACILIGGQLATLLLVFGFAGIGRFTTPELFSSIGIIGPLFAAYTTVAVRRMLGEVPFAQVQPISLERAVISLTIPSAFVVFVIASIVWKAFGSLTFDDFLKLVGLVQTTLGVYIGYIVESILLGKRLSTADAGAAITPNRR